MTLPSADGQSLVRVQAARAAKAEGRRSEGTTRTFHGIKCFVDILEAELLAQDVERESSSRVKLGKDWDELLR